MNEEQIFDKINGMLAESEYPMEIKDIADLEDFLNDVSNTKLSFYDEIGDLYNELLGYEGFNDELM